MRIIDGILSGVDKVSDWWFGDAKVKGTKSGIKRASREYSPIINKISKVYAKTEELLDLESKKLRAESSTLLEQLSQLEKERDCLKRMIARQTQKLGVKAKSLEVKHLSLAVNSVVGDQGSVLDSGVALHERWKRRRDEAEEEAYEKMVASYKRKEKELKANLRRIRAKLKKALASNKKLIADILEDIASVSKEIEKLSNIYGKLIGARKAA